MTSRLRPCPDLSAGRMGVGATAQIRGKTPAPPLGGGGAVASTLILDPTLSGPGIGFLGYPPRGFFEAYASRGVGAMGRLEGVSDVEDPL